MLDGVWKNGVHSQDGITGYGHIISRRHFSQWPSSSLTTTADEWMNGRSFTTSQKRQTSSMHCYRQRIQASVRMAIVLHCACTKYQRVPMLWRHEVVHVHKKWLVLPAVCQSRNAGDFINYGGHFSSKPMHLVNCWRFSFGIYCTISMLFTFLVANTCGGKMVHFEWQNRKMSGTNQETGKRLLGAPEHEYVIKLLYLVIE